MAKVTKHGGHSYTPGKEVEPSVGNSSSVSQEQTQKSEELAETESQQPVLTTESHYEQDVTESSTASQTDGSTQGTTSKKATKEEK